MENKKKDDNNSRRNFLKLGILAGAGTVAAGAILATGKKASGESGEKIKVLTTSGEVMEVDKNFLTLAPKDREESHEGIPGRKFVMVIDLAKCKNARKCVESCQKGHNLPKGEEFMKVYLMQDSEKSAPYWFPKPCYHCDNPQCVSVCPVGATYKRSDGIVLIDNERCIGCKFCMTGLPRKFTLAIPIKLINIVVMNELWIAMMRQQSVANRLPYGNKSKDTITRFSLEIASFLVRQHVKCVVVACNPASCSPDLHFQNRYAVIQALAPGYLRRFASTRQSSQSHLCSE